VHASLEHVPLVILDVPKDHLIKSVAKCHDPSMLVRVELERAQADKCTMLERYIVLPLRFFGLMVLQLAPKEETGS
jgi:hypothetical protein